MQDPHHVYLDLDVINNNHTPDASPPYLKFEEIKKRLGLEFNVNQILKAKPNTKEHSYIMLH